MELLLPLLNPHAFQGQGFGQPGFGFGQQRCGQDRPCSSQQAKARQAAAAEQQGQWPEFDPSNFGLGQGFNLEELLNTAAAFVASLSDAQAKNKSATSGSCAGPKSTNHSTSMNDFEVRFDVAQFKPEELTVKTVDNFIVLEGVHEEREDDNGFVSRQFTRRIPIPAGIDAGGIKCSFTAGGQLVISAPKLVPVQPAAEEKSIPIQFGAHATPSQAENEESKQEGSAPASNSA